MPPSKLLRRGFFVLTILFSITACSKKERGEVVIDLPADFTGVVQVRMGVAGAPSLPREGRGYRITVPPDGNVVTSTIVSEGNPKFAHVDPSRIWGYSQSTAKTGDGVPVGGSIEFFVGTKEQYESSEVKKRKSGLDRLFAAPRRGLS